MMKSKIVYVITSGVKDIYPEQLYVSMYTLRHYNENVKITIVMDDDTFNNITAERKYIINYADEIVSVDVPHSYTKMQQSRYIKTNLRNIIDGDFLFVDSDTVICDNLCDVDLFDKPLMAVPDFHTDISHHLGKGPLQELMNKEKIKNIKHKFFFNSGVMYVKDTAETRRFYEIWHAEWKRLLSQGINTDQQSLLIANEKTNFLISKLPDIYNCQIMFNGIKYLVNAKIIHYFSSNITQANIEYPYYFQNYDYLRNLKDTHKLDKITLKAISNPKEAFSNNVILRSGDLELFHNTPYYAAVKKIYFKYPRLIKFINGVYRIFKN